MAECIFCSLFRHTKFSGGKGGLTVTGSQTTSTRNALTGLCLGTSLLD